MTDESFEYLKSRLLTLETAFRHHCDDDQKLKEQEERFEKFLQERNSKLYKLWMETR